MRSIFSIILIFFLMSCDEFKSESFSTSTTDSKAIDALADSVSKPFSTKLLNDYKSSWVNSRLDTIRTALHDSLTANGVVCEVLDTAYTVSVSAANDTSYAAFSGTTAGIIVFIGEYIDLNIIDAAGNAFAADDFSMELSTVYESLNGMTTTDHYLKSRYVFSALPQNTVLQFIKTEQTLRNNFKLIINQ